MDIRTGDKVIVIAGNDKGEKGRVVAVYPDKNRVIIEGVRLVKRHTKPNRSGIASGGILEKAAPIHMSNVALVDKHGKPTRIRHEVEKNGERVRIAVTTGEVIESPKG